MFYYLKALYRFTVFYLCHSRLAYETYANPDNVAGYTGWYEWNDRVFAFTHQTGGLQFRWK
jgi:hypothetical protein